MMIAIDMCSSTASIMASTDLSLGLAGGVGDGKRCVMVLGPHIETKYWTLVNFSKVLSSGFFKVICTIDTCSINMMV